MNHVDGWIDAVLTGRLLSAADDAAFRAHLRGCERCRAKYDAGLAVLRLASGHAEAFAPGELERLETRAVRLAKPVPASAPLFDWRFAFAGAALAAVAVLTVLLWPRTPVGTVLVASKGLMLDGVLVGKDAVVYEDTVISTGKEDAAVLLEGAQGRRGLLLRPNTRVRAYSSDEVGLEAGRLRVQVQKPSQFLVRAGEVRVEQSAPGTFVVEQKPEGPLVAVHQGTVTVTAPGGSVELKDGQETALIDGALVPAKAATANALVEDRGTGTVWDAILRFLKQLVDAISRALAGE